MEAVSWVPLAHVKMLPMFFFPGNRPVGSFYIAHQTFLFLFCLSSSRNSQVFRINTCIHFGQHLLHFKFTRQISYIHTHKLNLDSFNSSTMSGEDRDIDKNDVLRKSVLIEQGNRTQEKKDAWERRERNRSSENANQSSGNSSGDNSELGSAGPSQNASPSTGHVRWRKDVASEDQGL